MLEELVKKDRNLIMSATKVVVTASLITLAGCAGLIQTGSFDKVHESFNQKNYPETLTLIRQAEHLNELDPRHVAELTYVKARSLEELGRSDEANALFCFLKLQHVNSQYVALAQLQLENSKGIKTTPLLKGCSL